MMKPINKNKWIAIIIIFVIFISAFRLTWINFITKFDYEDNPIAERGVLDLRGTKFTATQTLTLNGEWEFYPSTFLTPGLPNNALDEEKKKFQHVPENWNDAFPKDHKPSYYYGTYKLRILLDDHDYQVYGLKLDYIYNASAVYVNGQFIGQTGQPATKLEDHYGNNIPYTVTFKPVDNEIDLVIHVSANAKKGGILKPLRIGTIEAINLRTYLSIGLQLLLCVVLLLHSVYALIANFIGSKPNKGLIYFSILLLFAILSVLVSDDKLLLKWFSFEYEWSLKIIYFSYIGVSAFIPLVINSLYPLKKKNNFVLGYSYFCILYFLFVLIAEPKYIIMTSKVLLSSALIFSIIVSIATIMLQKSQKNNKELIFLLLGCISIGVNILWTILAPINMHYPFDLIFAVLAFTAFWFKRYFLVTAKAEQLTKKLQLEDKQKDEFLVNTSHELRNPLHGIMNIVQTILEDKVISPSIEHRKRLEILMDVSKRMSLMLNDLLDVKRLKEKTVQLNVGKINIHAIVNGVLDMTKLMAEGKPLQFHVVIPHSFPAIKADENRLIQILFNLIHNAIKYTDEGSITIRAETNNGLAFIHVEDTGIGIEEHALTKIFNPYEQTAINSSSVSGGFGLGLNICKELVELHEGTLTVRSTIGKGSIFTFSLPIMNDIFYDEELNNISKTNNFIDMTAAAIEPSDSVQLSLKQRNASKKKAKILAVDDDTVNLHVLTQILEAENYEMITVTSAHQAMAKLKEDHYDLIISDVMMPQISGYELTVMIRERYTISELPILLLTARARSEDILTGFQSGANDYVMKPVDASELKARVRALTELKLSIEEQLRMEGAWLQSQIQPHFLFNTLNSIAALGMMDVTKMQELLEEFSNYLRLSFDFENTNPFVPLDHELSLVQSYLFIENARFGDRLNVQWDMDDNIDIKIPPLTIQPLVENAIKHGILQRTNGGTLSIHIKKQPEYIKISIQDDGIGMTENKLEQLFKKENESQERMGVGIRNTDRRIKQLFGEGLKIKSTPNLGTVVTFHVPAK
ncbi:ATP-binding protein [Cytobacillus massiliigabonensis]|uniref:ATP-binding protein n=1 Tax=Cytobacillus massiliigabonensis TaxID=1871011 RepID=UPI001F45564D|nr:ATP-binding protein [Cytobacillus massiliigabonensis]